jgi:hypothetical protein
MNLKIIDLKLEKNYVANRVSLELFYFILKNIIGARLL